MGLRLGLELGLRSGLSFRVQPFLASRSTSSKYSFSFFDLNAFWVWGKGSGFGERFRVGRRVEGLCLEGLRVCVQGLGLGLGFMVQGFLAAPTSVLVLCLT